MLSDYVLSGDLSAYAICRPLKSDGDPTGSLLFRAFQKECFVFGARTVRRVIIYFFCIQPCYRFAWPAVPTVVFVNQGW